MALREIIGLDHIPVSATVDWRIYGTPSLTWWSTNRTSIRVTRDAQGWMQSPYVTNLDSLLQITQSSRQDPNFKRIYVGVRLRVLAAGIGISTAYVAYLDSHLEVNTSGRTILALLTVGDIPQFATGKEVYLEISIDRENFVVKRRLDGVDLSDVPIPTGAIRNNLLAGNWILVCVNTHRINTNGRMGMKDIYIADDVSAPNNPYVDYLGPQVIHPLVVDEAVGSSWTSPSGNGIVADLNLPLNTTYAGVAGDDENPLQLGFQDIDLAGQDVTAVQIDLSGSRTAGAYSGLEVSLDVQDDVLIGSTVPMPNTQTNSLRAGLYASGPNGVPWKNYNFNTVKMTLTPK